ncbi:hypothetical protein NW752_009438 [Fusarium irregulare]|uniref:Uncharacterized protein n=1 Tax=Fusarium irregulare TaxID=2494466 RepID=A0A9W8U4D5_9HYPO|nr:hypothetical protein NW766_012716 [Fusarium irregulare]KAJ4009141.1 hypothetical protein NW752_009438 [Fusarium irregulare]
MSSPEKNRLEYLPTLVQKEIIVHLGTKQSHECLFEAYQSMGVDFDHYEVTTLQQILQRLISDDKEENILKDILMMLDMKALRNLDFSLAEMLSYRKRRTLSKAPDLDELREVHSLVSRYIVLIEDYVSKATSKYPPRAYMGVPDLNLGTGSTFKGQSLDTKLVPFMSLRWSERHRLLRAFVRYELVCRIYRAFPLQATAQFHREVRLFNAFDTGPDAVQQLVFTSVHDYCRTLYGAGLAHIGDAWLPDPPALCPGGPKSTRKGYRRLLFPNSMYFDADEYLKDLPLGTEYGPTVIDRLACCGLNPITTFLAILKVEGGQGYRTRSWLEGIIVRSGVFPPWIYEFDQAQYGMRASLDSWVLTQIGSPNPDSSSLPLSLASNSRVHEYSATKAMKPWAKAYVRQVQIYRQRAWGLLDDKRLYANAARPWPTYQQIHNLETMDQRAALDEREFARLELTDSLQYLTRLSGFQERRKRRSQLWQEFWAGDRSHEPFWYIQEAQPDTSRSRQPQIVWSY